MEAFKFVRKVGKHGIIKIPELERFANQKADIIVTLKSEEESNHKKNGLNIFLEDWAGFFSMVDTKDTKYKYLIEKYK